MISNIYPNLNGSVFIVTYGRSGSTLLQSLLQSIPQSHIVGENYNILGGIMQSCQRARRAKAVWGKKPHPQDHPWHGASEIRPVRFERRMTRLFVEEIIQPPKDVRWIGFKEIRYMSYENDFEHAMNFLIRNFPNPYIVFNSRRGEDVAKSSWWKNHETSAVIDMVNTMDERFASYASSNPFRTFHAKYEETVSDPKSLQPLFDKLGEDLNIESVYEKLQRQLKH